MIWGMFGMMVLGMAIATCWWINDGITYRRGFQDGKNAALAQQRTVEEARRQEALSRFPSIAVARDTAMSREKEEWE